MAPGLYTFYSVADIQLQNYRLDTKPVYLGLVAVTLIWVVKNDLQRSKRTDGDNVSVNSSQERLFHGNFIIWFL